MTSRTYRVGKSEITVRFGDIIESRAEVIVSSDDFQLSMGGGVSQSILRAGGSAIFKDAAKQVPASAGDVIVTTAGGLPAKYLFHAVTIGGGGVGPDQRTQDAMIRQVCQKAMHLLAALGCRSIAFPAIGTGRAGIGFEISASQMATSLVSTLIDASEPYVVELHLHDQTGVISQDEFFIFFEHFAAKTMALEATQGAAGTSLEPPTPTEATSISRDEARDMERRSQIFLMLRHLDGQRNVLEESLIDALAGNITNSDQMIIQLRVKLSEIQDLRRVYEDELTPATANAAPLVPNSVFLSSTYVDLQPHREALRHLIEQLRMAFIGMEQFAPAGETPGTYIRKKVNQANAYVGILGKRYGYIDPTSGLSMTELEYRQAVVSKKPIYMFVMSDQAVVTAGMVERDPEALAKLNAFTDRVLKSSVVGMFCDVDELVSKAASVLKALAQET